MNIVNKDESKIFTTYMYIVQYMLKSRKEEMRNNWCSDMHPYAK